MRDETIQMIIRKNNVCIVVTTERVFVVTMDEKTIYSNTHQHNAMYKHGTLTGKAGASIQPQLYGSNTKTFQRLATIQDTHNSA